MMKNYQWYAPPGIPGADVGERRGICRWNLPPRDWYLVGNSLKLLLFVVLEMSEKFFANSTDTHLSLSHTV